MAEKIIRGESLYTSFDKINASIDNSNTSKAESASAKTTADGAVIIANTADGKSDSTQLQLDNIVINSGTSDAETIQARDTFPLLKDRLNSTDQQLADKAEQTDLVTGLAGKRDTATLIGLNDATPEFLAAVEGGAGTSFDLLSIPRNESVNPASTTFITTGKNMFNKQKAIPGMLNITNGVTGASASYKSSDFMPIKNGLSYMINKCRNYVLFNASQVFVSGADNPSNASATFTATFDGYVKATVFNDNVDSCQVEIGSVITSYESYKILVDSLSINDFDGANLKDTTITAKKTDFAETTKNLFNKVKSNSGFMQITGVPVASPTYKYSDYIPLKMLTNAVINKCRNYVVYNTSKVFVAGVDNPTLAPIVINRTSDSYIRFSYLIVDEPIIQFELGTAPTAYEEYGVKVVNLLFTDSQKSNLLNSMSSSEKHLKVIKNGEVFEITSKFDSTQDIAVTTNRSSSSNGSFNFVKTVIGGLQVHDTSDDIVPIRTNITTLGANHGYTNVVKITMVGHGKVTADLGSQWSDGSKVYTLLDIAGDILTLGCPYTVTNDIVSSPYVAPVATLTHVSGATNTGNIAITTINGFPQLYPSINNKSVKYYLDGIEVASDGTYYGDELQVRESYNIMDYKGIIDYAQANIGVSYKNDNVLGIVKMSINYTFTKGCNCSISHGLKALKKVSLTACGFLQSVALVAASHTLKRYMPNVLPKSGVDFKTLVDMTSYASNILIYPADFITANKPPNRHVDWLYSGANKKYGFTMGYIIDKTNSKTSDRLAQIGSNYYWDLRSTKKSYPAAINVLTMNAGEYKTFQMYRNYLAPSDATNINIVEDKKDTYVYVDYHQAVTGKNVVLDKHIGKTITIIDSENFTLLNDTVDAEGVTFNVSGTYGYAILKVS